MKRNSMFSLLAAIPAFLLCFAARFVQIAGGTDMNTGFLNKDNGIIINLGFYGSMVIVFVAVLALCLLDKKRSGAYHTNDISGFVDVKAVMLGFPMLVAGALALYEGYAQTKAVLPSGFLMFVDFVLGAAMVIIAFAVLYNKEFKPFLGFCMIFPAIYYTLRGIGMFLKRMAVTTIPEYLIEGLTIIGAAIFFMQLAKLLTGNETKTTRPLLSAVGITTSVTMLSNAVAVIVADIFDPYNVSVRIVSSAVEAEIAEQQKRASGYFGYHMAYVSWVDVLMAVCIILTLVALYRKNKPVEIPAEAEETAE